MMNKQGNKKIKQFCVLKLSILKRVLPASAHTPVPSDLGTQMLINGGSG